MSFLIDTDIFSAHLRGNPVVTARFEQYSAQLHVSTVCLAELKSWLYRKNTPRRFVAGFAALITEIPVLPVDEVVAETCGNLSAQLRDVGQPVDTTDLLIAATAIVHGLTLVTHNTKDFARVPGLRLADWAIA